MPINEKIGLLARASPLVVISHVTHYLHGERLYAYGPYAREIDVWADLFPEVIIAAPCRSLMPPGDCLPFERPNISIAPQIETGGTTLTAKTKQVLALPLLTFNLLRVMLRAGAVHVRCPGNLGLLGTVLAPLVSSRLVAKYAGQWNGYPGEALTAHLQRVLLRSRWWRGPVTVYGEWPDQPPHVISFFTSLMTAEQMERARRVAQQRRPGAPLRLLYAGRLSPDKNVDVSLRAVAALRKKGIDMSFTVVGTGPKASSLRTLSTELGLEGLATFAGAVPFEKVLDYYERSDVLLLASESEGWPKAIAEAMSFGLVCVGSNRGFVREMLADGRGFLVEPGDIGGLTATLLEIHLSPQQMSLASSRAAAWAQRYSLEGLGKALEELLLKAWEDKLHIR